jgi:hypothetical protein
MPQSRRPARVLVTGLLALIALLAACGGSSSSASSRPHSNAQLVIVSPAANQVIGPTVTLQLNLIGGRVVPPSQVKGKLRGDEGHIHVYLDKLLVSMTYGLTQDVAIPTPGPHVIQAEFVATDHLSFSPKVMTAVLFQRQ